MSRDFEVRLALARAIAASDRAFLLDSDNKRTGVAPLREAVESGLAFYVLTHPSVLALDVDREDGIEVAIAFASRYPRYRPVVVASGGTGRAHAFMRIPVAKERLRVESAARREGFDVRRNGAGIRPPLTPHRHGNPVKVVWVAGEPGTPEKALQALQPGVSRERPSVEEALETGWPKGERSEGLFWLACQYLRMGRDENRYVRDVLAHPQGAGLKPGENRSHPSRERYLSDTWRKATVAVESSSHRPECDRWLDAVAAWLSTSRGSIGNALAIARYLAGHARGGCVSVSLRQLSERAGCGTSTVKRRLWALVRAGFLRVERSDRAECRAHSNAYVLDFPPHRADVSAHPGSTPPSLAGLRMCQNVPDRVKDALWGRPAWKAVVLSLSQEESLFVPDLARTLGRKVESVLRTLRQMRASGLVEALPGGRYRLVPLDAQGVWSDCSEARGTFGRMDRLRRDHERQRLGYLGHLEALDAPGVRAILAAKRAEAADALRTRRVPRRPTGKDPAPSPSTPRVWTNAPLMVPIRG